LFALNRIDFGQLLAFITGRYGLTVAVRRVAGSGQ